MSDSTLPPFPSPPTVREGMLREFKNERLLATLAGMSITDALRLNALIIGGNE
jgi:hypothetical protein